MTADAHARSAHAAHERPLAGIACKVMASLIFAFMYAAIRALGPYFPVGEIVFFRSAFGVPIVIVAALLTGGPQLLITSRIDSHAFRSIAGTLSMFCSFAAYTLLPLADATAISFAAPLFVVVLAAVMLGEHVRLYRWTAVIIGFAGVLVIAGPEANIARGAAIGAAVALAGAGLTAFAMIFLRRMSAHEHSITIAFYFMLTSAAIGALTIVLGWNWPSGEEAMLLIFTGLAGGVGQLFLSFSYRFSEASVLAPFDYVALIWAVVLGYFFFDELPSPQVWIGSAVVIAMGLFILWRERQLGRGHATASAR